MQKFGRVILRDKDGIEDTLSFVWSEVQPTYERIDVYDDPNKYNLIDTSSCVASYIRKKEEVALGEIDIIKKIFKIKNTVSTFYAKQERDVKIEDGKIVLTVTKKDEDLGLRYVFIMHDSAIYHEEFTTPTGSVIIDSTDSSDDSQFDPLNIGSYQKFNTIEGYKSESEQKSDYHSYEYLMSKYPELQNLLDKDIVVIENMEQYRERLDNFKNSDFYLRTVDIESSGLDMNDEGEDYVTGVILSYGRDNATYYPFKQEKFDFNLPMECLQEIWEAIENLPKHIKVIAHNAMMEKKGFWKELGTPVRVDIDTMHLSVLVNPLIRKGLHTLKNLAYKYSGQFFLDLDKIFIGPIKFNVLPKEIVNIYACPDGYNPIIVYEALMKELPKDEQNLALLEYELVSVKTENEFYGLRCDRERLQHLLDVEDDKVTRLREMFQSIHRTSANINSPDVKRDIFYNKLRCPVEVRTKTNQPSTSSTAVDRIVEIGKLKEYDKDKTPPDIKDKDGRTVVKGEDLISNRYPSLVILQKYNKARKELSALERIKRNCHKDRVQFYINQTGAASGRQTSDAHQYSDMMKSIIIADSPYHNFWSADFKQIELRILAFLSGEESLIKLENDPEVDIHRAILSIITGKPMWDISASERSDGKRVNFGVVYMMSKFGLTVREKGPHYTNEDLLRNEKRITDFFNGLPHVKKFIADNEKFIRENGYIKTVCGRYRYFREILDPTTDEKTKTRMVRAGNNTPVQGFGADLLKQVEVRLYKYIRKKGWDKCVDCDGRKIPLVRLMLSIHDEVLVSTHKSIPIEEIIIMFKECMEINIEGAPSFFAAPAMVNNWLDGKDDAYEIPLLFRDEVIRQWKENKKTILHTSTFIETTDAVFLKEWEDYKKLMIKKCVTPDDFNKDGKLKLTDETKNKCKTLVEQDGKVDLVISSLIASDEEYTESKKFDVAIERLLDERFSPYLYDLNMYRKERLVGYMEDLIAKYKTQEEVTKHVTHPDLTHVLISAYVDKKIAKTMSHRDSIAEAVKQYFISRTGTVVNVADRLVEYDSDEELKSYEQLEQYVHFDETGELIVEDNTLEGEEEDMDIDINEPVNFDDYRVDRTFVLYLLDKVIIDFTGFKIDDKAEKLHQALFALSNENDYYEAYYNYGDRQVKAGFKLPYKPDIVESLVKTHLLGEQTNVS